MRANISDTKKTETKGGNHFSRKPMMRFSQNKNSPVDHILHLQRNIGNRAVARLIKSGAIQRKLIIGKPNDIYEKEADSVADRVMSMPEGVLAPAPASSPSLKRQEETLPNHWMQKQPDEEEELKAKPLAEQITPLIQRQADEEEEVQPQLQRQANEEEEEQVQAKLLQRQEAEEEEEAVQTKILQRQESEEEEEPVQAKSLQRQESEEEEEAQTKLQRQPEEEEETAQTKASPDNTPEVTSNIESSINEMKGGGQPLSESTRSFFEPRFGTDFSQVRVHTDGKAGKIARTINAKAFTTGKDIVFNSSQYSPGTSSGKRLMAHELTHVLQQRGRSAEMKKETGKGTPPASLHRGGVVQRRIRLLNHLGDTITAGVLSVETAVRLIDENSVQFDINNRSRVNWAKRIVQDMAVAGTELYYDSEQELIDEVKKRLWTSYLMRISQGDWYNGIYRESFAYPHREANGTIECDTRVNRAADRYWERKYNSEKKYYYFILTGTGKDDAYNALQLLFTPQDNPCDRTLVYCDHLTTILHFRALAEQLGEEEFNNRVEDERGDINIELSPFGYRNILSGAASGQPSLRRVELENREDLLIGDHVIFWNHPIYDVLTQVIPGTWRLENAILVDRENGIDKFQGHGFNTPITEDEMISGMHNKIIDIIDRIKSRINEIDVTNKDERNNLEEEFNDIIFYDEVEQKWIVEGTTSYGVKVDTELEVPGIDTIPGLYKPWDPENLFRILRPMESL